MLRPPSYSKWRVQGLAPVALVDLLQNGAFALTVPHFKFLLVPEPVTLVSWQLSFSLDATVAEWWVN